MNRLVMFTALFMTFSTTFLLYKVLEQEGLSRKEVIRYNELLNKNAICQGKMDSFELLLTKDKVCY